MHRSKSIGVAAALSAGLLAPLALPLATASAKPRAHAASSHHARNNEGYVGTTSQKSGKLALPADLRSSRNGKAVSRFDLEWIATCQDKSSLTGLSISLNKAISSSGHFSSSNSFKENTASGGSATFGVSLAGYFNRPNLATGTFDIKITYADKSGKTTNSCDSGKVTWSVTP
ncbi:MAG: hypothetical protein DLM64_13985 [Solirubrobacterales bacterium]|nr:MAG: hypothetical protein DLM64_13985 [Solirubrobacterales bacterium]